MRVHKTYRCRCGVYHVIGRLCGCSYVTYGTVHQTVNQHLRDNLCIKLGMLPDWAEGVVDVWRKHGM